MKANVSTTSEGSSNSNNLFSSSSFNVSDDWFVAMVLVEGCSTGFDGIGGDLLTTGGGGGCFTGAFDACLGRCEFDGKREFIGFCFCWYCCGGGGIKRGRKERRGTGCDGNNGIGVDGFGWVVLAINSSTCLFQVKSSIDDFGRKVGRGGDFLCDGDEDDDDELDDENDDDERRRSETRRWLDTDGHKSPMVVALCCWLFSCWDERRFDGLASFVEDSCNGRLRSFVDVAITFRVVVDVDGGVLTTDWGVDFLKRLKIKFECDQYLLQVFIYSIRLARRSSSCNNTVPRMIRMYDCIKLLQKTNKNNLCWYDDIQKHIIFLKLFGLICKNMNINKI